MSTTLIARSTAPLLRTRLKLAAAWLSGLALLAWLLSRTPLDQVAQAVARPAAGVWLVALAGLLASYVLRAWRLQVVLDLAHHPRQAPGRWLGLRTDALRVILMHNAAVNLLPMRAGELSFPWLASRELGLPLARAVACLLWMRIQDLVILIVLGLALWPGLDLSLRLAGVAMVMGGWRLSGWALSRWLGGQDGHQAARPAGKLRSLAQRFQSALAEPAHHRPMAWGLTLANWGLKLAVGATLLATISQAPWLAAWTAALGGELAAIVPLQGPAGFGTYEAGVWAGMAAGLHGTHATGFENILKQAIGAALALHVCFLVCAVIAGALASALGRGQSTPGGPLPPRQPG